ncbi:hypothetical protein AMTR_s00008p00055030 [Amborella trichopoda]|uniref:Uncharacterized protein n=1 Tax=Amborella trichopoda TaxID=13333 RepID=W1NIE9_AMBTC|nr:hypothetical protein AMTR_s00008p00055030 [Amborella trichopoda]
MDEDINNPPRTKTKKKSNEQQPRERYENGDPTVGTLGEPIGRYEFLVEYGNPKPTQPKMITKECAPPSYQPPPPYQPPDAPIANTPPLRPYYHEALKLINLKEKIEMPKIKEIFAFSPSSSNYTDQFPPLKPFEIPII